jgi:cysteine synthase
MRQKRKIAENIVELIGKTPMVYLNRLREDRPGIIAAKLEFLNPSGSVKDRTVLGMMNDAEKHGFLRPGGTIIEPTSGNTGISLASFCSIRGYPLILVIPESASIERVKIIEAYGAKVVLTPADLGMRGAIEKADELAEEIKGSFIPGQFTNFSNPKIHEKTTAQEIWKDSDGEISALIAGIGTGGTISGIGKLLKKKEPGIKIVGVEPAESSTLTNGSVGKHEIQGIGPGFVPAVLDVDMLDEIIPVNSTDAFKTARQIGQMEGFLPGISSGAAAFAALKLAERKEYKGKLIVAIFPDSGIKYFSTGLYS